jgi:hypothetical protein
MKYVKYRKSERSTVPIFTSIPEASKVSVTVLLLEAVDDLPRIIANLEDFIELNEVILNDEDSHLRVRGLVIRSKHPIVITGQTVATSNHNIGSTIDCVAVPNDDVVVLQNVALDLVQQLRHLQHLLVEI